MKWLPTIAWAMKGIRSARGGGGEGERGRRRKGREDVIESAWRGFHRKGRSLEVAMKGEPPPPRSFLSTIDSPFRDASPGPHASRRQCHPGSHVRSRWPALRQAYQARKIKVRTHVSTHERSRARTYTISPATPAIRRRLPTPVNAPPLPLPGPSPTPLQLPMHLRRPKAPRAHASHGPALNHAGKGPAQVELALALTRATSPSTSATRPHLQPN